MDTIYIKFLRDEIERMTAEVNRLTRSINICTKPICATCGSDDVRLDALVCWDVETQEYEIANIMDDGHSCNNCDSGCRIKEVPA